MCYWAEYELLTLLEGEGRRAEQSELLLESGADTVGEVEGWSLGAGFVILELEVVVAGAPL